MEINRNKKLQEIIDSKENGFIKVITGMRRCGKSYLMNHLFYNYLLKIGIKKSHIIQFAFDSDEDIDLLDSYFPNEKTRIKKNKNEYYINSKKFRSYIKEKITEEGMYYLLLDEIQTLENFSATLNSYLRHDNYDVYVTGSNSKLLSSDIATEFRGRGDIIHLQPLTFKEIYDAIGGDKRDLLDNYLIFGGLPQCVLAMNNEKRISFLKEIYSTTYIKDLKDRNRINNEQQFEELFSILASNISSLTNPEKISNTFKSKEKVDISSTTIKNYISYLENAYLISKSERYDIKGRKYISTPSKYYFTDLGLRNAVINFRQNEKTHLMENLIYNELINRGFQVDIGAVEKYIPNKSGTYSKSYLEIDFIANRGYEKYYIQSAFSIEDEYKKNQEEKSLNETNDSFQKIIIVYDSIIRYRNENGILFIGLLDFLMDDNLL